MKLTKRLKVTASILFLSAALAACGDSGSSSEGGKAGSAGDAGSAGQSGSAGSMAGSAGSMGGSAGSMAGSAGSMAGSAGSMGGTAGTGGTGMGMSLADQGIAQNDCAPNDGPAMSVRIGQKSQCAEMNDPSPQAWFLAYPAQTQGLMNADTWTQGPGMNMQVSVYWLPDGAGGQGESTKNAILKVVSADDTQIVFEYLFETMAGETYSGNATVVICASMPMCG
jgi:hypothetical protein